MRKRCKVFLKVFVSVWKICKFHINIYEPGLLNQNKNILGGPLIVESRKKQNLPLNTLFLKWLYVNSEPNLSLERGWLHISVGIFWILYVIPSWKMIFRRQKLRISLKKSDSLYVIGRKSAFVKERCLQINSSISFHLYITFWGTHFWKGSKIIKFLLTLNYKNVIEYGRTK